MNVCEKGPTLEIEELTISYRQQGRFLRVIENVSLHIQSGEAYGLVGESGCGKTTVAMAVMHYLPPSAVVEAGRILFTGEDVLRANKRTLRRWRGDRVAMVYQDPGSALNPTLRIGEQIAEVYRHHCGMGPKDAMEAARTMLQTVQIADASRMLERYPHQLSGGQQQRVMFAMALATDPDLLVLDEPTTGLDATVEADVLDLVEQLRGEFNSSILFISHNLAIVARMCERVGVLYGGRLVEEGRARELFAEPRHPYTLALLRCVPRTGMRKDRQRLSPIPGSLPPPGAEISGCVYADRCPLVRDHCRAEPPPLYHVNGQRTSRCFHHGEVPHLPRDAKINAPPSRPNEMHTVLRVEDLRKTYHAWGADVTAVEGVSVSIHRGEIFGLVGESGSGKTSLAKCIVGLSDASDGTIEFDGTRVTGAVLRRNRELRRNLQMVFQNPDTALNPRRTVRGILGRSLRLLVRARSRTEQEARLGSLISSVRLEPRHLDLRPTALSGGLKQRVAIARAFAGEPALVLCDEPTSALDVSVQAAILNLLADLQAIQGLAYIFISHDLAVVRYLSDRIGVMYLGQLVEVGEAEDVFSPPHHPYTEALISAMPSLDLDTPRVRIKLDGPIPSPNSPPSGCRFHPRCPRYLGDVCREQPPPWQQDKGNHTYRCHIPPAELREMQGTATESTPAPNGPHGSC